MQREIPDEDLWATDSGLVSDYEGTVIDAWFNIDTNIANSPTFMWLKMSTDNEQTPEITERYNCGPDWASHDGGETVVHPTKKKFNKNSQAGIFIDKAIELSGGAESPLRGRGAPTTAKTWLGTRWFMEAVTRKGKNNQTGEDWTSTRNFPAKFLGTEDGEIAQSVRTDSQDSPVQVPVTDSPIMQIAQSLAKTLPHQAWVDKMLEVDGVLADDELIRSLSDSTPTGLYETLKGK